MSGAGTFSYILLLVAQKSFATALDVLRTEIAQNPDDLELKQQYAEVLALDGKKAEAADALSGLADAYGRSGQAGKAIAALKKMQQLDSSRSAGDGRLARLVKEREPAVPSARIPAPAPPARAPESRTEEVLVPLPRSMTMRAPAPPPPEPGGQPEFITETIPIPPEFTAGKLPVGGILEPEPSTGAQKTLGSMPLFSGFSAEELHAVIRGLRLISLQPGDILVTEGEPGDSLFLLTTGTVKAFVRDAKGRNHGVREMKDGSFFGEVSILTARPRSATLVAATGCELLELDRATLEEISGAHPRVRTVLQSFCSERLNSAAERVVRSPAARA